MKTLILTLFLLAISSYGIAQTMKWTASIGSAFTDEGIAIKTDDQANVYTLGSFKDTIEVDPDTTTLLLVSNGENDLFMHKMDSAGNLLWAKSFGGFDDEFAHALYLDEANNIYTCGIFEGTVDFDPGPGVFNLTSGGNTNMFVQKLDSDGHFIWANSFGSVSFATARNMCVDQAGSVYTTGYFTGLTDFDPDTGTTLLNTSGSSAFVQKTDDNGNFIWANQFAGPSFGDGMAIAVDASNNLYTIGYFRGTSDFDPGLDSFFLTSNGLEDVYLQKMDSSGSFLWAKSFGGNLADYSTTVLIDDAGDIYTCGVFRGTADFDPGPNTSNLTSNGEDDIFIQKLDSEGNFIWAKSFGGAQNDWSYGMSADSDGNIFLTGDFQESVDFDPGPNATTRIAEGLQDIFILKLDAAGSFEWALTYGSKQRDYGSSITVDASGGIYTTGAYSDVVDFEPGNGTSNFISRGERDLFIQKLIECNITGNSISVDGTTLIANSKNGEYQWLDCDSGYAAISGATLKAFSATRNGRYAVQLTKHACIDTSDCMSITTGFLDAQNGSRFSVYPNPTQGDFTVDFGSHNKTGHLNIQDIAGRVIQHRSFQEAKQLQLSVTEPSGIYFIEVVANQGVNTIKLMIE